MSCTGTLVGVSGASQGAGADQEGSGFPGVLGERGRRVITVLLPLPVQHAHQPVDRFVERGLTFAVFGLRHDRLGPVDVDDHVDFPGVLLLGVRHVR